MLLSFAPFQARPAAAQINTPEPPLPTEVEILPETGQQDGEGVGLIGLIAIIALVVGVLALAFSFMRRRPPV